MRVLVDAHMLGQRETGNESYVRGLLAGLASQNDVSVAAAVEPGQPDTGDGRITWLPLESNSSWRRLTSGLARLCRIWRADVLHATYIAPVSAPCPVVISVHDVSFRRYPQYFSLKDRLLFSTVFPLSLRRAAAILTLSRHGREELRQFFPGIRAPIHVVPAAPAGSFAPMAPADAEPVLARHGLHRPFFLAVGNLQPRKNLVRLVEAYSGLVGSHPEPDLAIVGPVGFQSGEVQKAITFHGVAQRVRLLGYVPDGDLNALYNASIGLVYPSVYEGFGLPVVEAMACGRPVIAANTSSIPEVAGDAAMLVNPLDASAIRHAMERLLTEPGLASDLRERALFQAARFTWSGSAAAALSAYRQVCGAPGPTR